MRHGHIGDIAHIEVADDATPAQRTLLEGLIAQDRASQSPGEVRAAAARNRDALRRMAKAAQRARYGHAAWQVMTDAAEGVSLERRGDA